MAFVEFQDEEKASIAIKGLNNFELTKDIKLKVAYALWKHRLVILN